MKVLALGATNSKNSINKMLATYTARKISNNVEVIDLNDYEMDIYSVDREQQNGIPSKAKELFEKIGSSDVVVISFAEFNGSYTSAYKNIFDWMSRISQKVFQGKKVVYLSTSPGAYGAASVLKSAVDSIIYFDGQLVGSLSVPSFYENFSVEKQEITNEEIKVKILELAEKSK